MPIHVLPPEVAAKIAAGEVVERPASVVKELIENSIDAGARNIRVEARDGGQRLIRVVDDGIGIPRDELALAFARHATSKLTSIDDLETIRTLGFRGEALASVGAVSRLTMVSRPSDVMVGAQIRIEGGQQVRVGAQGAPTGTAVTVENLFYNVPARLKFLKAPATEAGHIHRVVTRYALAFPEIRFHLKLNERLSLQTSGNGSLYDVLLEVLGLETCRQMVALAENEGQSEAGGAPGRGGQVPVRVAGYVGAPSVHHAQRDHVMLFVNRRWVQDRLLTTAVIQAYHTLLPVGRYPVAVLSVTLAPAEVDVNVHPTKSEVKFRDQRTAFAAVQKAVRNAVVAGGQPPHLSVHPGATQHPDAWRGAGDWRQLSHFGFQVQRTLPGDTETGVPAAGGLPMLRVLGQLAQTYVIAEGPDGLYLVDQHAAHERVLYEQLERQRAEAAVPAQQLLQPALLELTPAQAAVLDAEAAVLAQLGFEIEPFGGCTYRLRAVPEILRPSDPAIALNDILAELAEGAVPLERRSEERVITTVCKRAAIKAGLPLAMREMQQLIHDLEQCQAPRTCPHGRPTMLHLSAAQLAREFGRA
jgi:DNA mismatch repair protein MutL